jgi:hypothetical protein
MNLILVVYASGMKALVIGSFLSKEKRKTKNVTYREAIRTLFSCMVGYEHSNFLTLPNQSQKHKSLFGVALQQ